MKEGRDKGPPWARPFVWFPELLPAQEGGLQARLGASSWCQGLQAASLG